MSKAKQAAEATRPYSAEDLEDVLDNPEWTEEDFARARPAREVLPPELYEKLVALSDKARAEQAAARRPVALRLDPDVLERLRASGPGWQERANAILRKAVGL